MKKQPELTKKTRQKIVDAFWNLYAEKSIEKITVKEITQLAGYNRSTFYEYFTDVYDVLEQIEQSLIPSAAEIPPVNFSMKKGEDIALGTFLQLFEKHDKYYTLLLGDRGDPAFQGKLKRSIKPMIFQMVCEQQEVRDPVMLDYALEYMLSAMIGILSYWFQQTQRPASDDLLALIYRLSQNMSLDYALNPYDTDK